MRVGFQNWEADISRVRHARSVLGNNKFLMVDAIMGSLRPCWNISEATKKINELDIFNLEWIEEPLHPKNINEHMLLKKNISTKLASGEALSGFSDYWTYLEYNTVDILQLDVTQCGGFTTAIEVIKLAEEKNIPIALHVWGSYISLAANINLAFCSDIIKWIEFPNVKLDLSKDVEIFKFNLKDGFLFRPINYIGLGALISKENILKYPYQKGTGWKI